MGTYTTFAQIGANAFHKSRVRNDQNHRPLHALSNVAPELLKLQCPQCEQTFPFGDSCATCGVDLVDRSRVLVVPKNTEQTRAPMKGSLFALAIGVLAITAPGLWVAFGGTKTVSTEGWAAIGVAAGVMALATGMRVLRTWSHRREAANVVRARDEVRAGVTATPTGDLPHDTERVRVRGHLRLAVEGPSVRAWVEDDLGIARLPVSGKLRVANAAQLCELEQVEAGQIVEVVGPGHRVHEAGGDYREAGSEFTFDEGAVLDLWV